MYVLANHFLICRYVKPLARFQEQNHSRTKSSRIAYLTLNKQLIGPECVVYLEAKLYINIIKIMSIILPFS